MAETSVDSVWLFLESMERITATIKERLACELQSPDVFFSIQDRSFVIDVYGMKGQHRYSKSLHILIDELRWSCFPLQRLDSHVDGFVTTFFQEIKRQVKP